MLFNLKVIICFIIIANLKMLKLKCFILKYVQYF